MYLLTLVHQLVLGAVVPGHLCLEAEYLGPHDGVALGHLPGARAGPLPRAVPEVMHDSDDDDSDEDDSDEDDDDDSDEDNDDDAVPPLHRQLGPQLCDGGVVSPELIHKILKSPQLGALLLAEAGRVEVFYCLHKWLSELFSCFITV